MPIKRLTGPNGSYVDVMDTDGYYNMLEVVNINKENHTDWQAGYEARPDDILICEYPKSGLHWLWEICTMLSLDRATHSTHLTEDSHMEIQPVARLNRLPSPRVLSTHAWPSMLPESAKSPGTKIVYVVRDPRAVAVSYYHHTIKGTVGLFQGTWRDFLWHFLNGQVPYNSWFEYTQKWEQYIKENRSQVHIIEYEELQRHPIEELKRLAQFLGAKQDTEFLREVHQACAFDKLKEVKEKQEAEKYGAQYFSVKFETFRKGSSDSWKDTFTVRDNEYFIEEYARKMGNSKIQLKCLL